MKKLPVIYCINLDRRPDRWKFMKEQFQKYSLIYKKFSAVDGKKVFLDIDNDYKKGWLACFASHLKIIDKMIQEEIKEIIILEDDAVIHPNFENILLESLKEIPEGPIFLYLGGSNIEYPIQVSKNIHVCQQTLSTVGYYINLEFAKNILYPLLKKMPINKEIDSFYTDLQKEHKMYIIMPRIVYQKEDFSDIQNGPVNYLHQRDF